MVNPHIRQLPATSNPGGVEHTRQSALPGGQRASLVRQAGLICRYVGSGLRVARTTGYLDEPTLPHWLIVALFALEVIVVSIGACLRAMSRRQAS